jgi:SRSO17 transposase
MVPKASPDTLPELAASLQPCAPLFRRSTSRARVARSLTGLLTALPRKHCATSAAAVAGTATARRPHLLTAAPGEPQARDQHRVRALAAQSPPHGRLVLDDTGLPQPGRRAVGGARPSAGPLGKGATGQGVVSAHSVADELASRAPVQWPVTAPLSLPETWATDGARRAQVQVPTAVALQTTPALALALGDDARAWSVPCAWGVADAGSGDHPTCRQGLEARQLASLLGLRSAFGVRLSAEGHAATLGPPLRPRGRGQPQQPRPAPL